MNNCLDCETELDEEGYCSNCYEFNSRCNHGDNSDSVDWDWMYCHACEEFLVDTECYGE